MIRLPLYRFFPVVAIWPARPRAVSVTSSGLVRRFVLISLVSIGTGAVLFGWLAGALVMQSLLERETLVTVQHIERVVVAGIPLESLRQLGDQPAGPEVASVARELLLLPEAVRVKVYDRKGTIVWSDEPALIGQNFGSEHAVQHALKGRVMASLEEIHNTPEHAYEAGRFKELESIYVPIRDRETGHVLAVFELYKHPDLFEAAIRHGQRIAWLIALAVGTLLVLTQISLVWRAGRTLARQHTELEARARELGAAQAEVQSAHVQLLRAEKLAALGEVTVAIAHGLRSPLANVRAVAQETLEGLAGDHPLRGPLEDIMTQVDRLEARLRSLLSSTGPFALALAREAVPEVVREVLTSMERRLEEAGARVELDLPDGLPEVIWDRVKIQQALQELLTNSLEAGARVIRVQGRATNGEGPPSIRLEIVDDGAGLAPGVQAHAFEAFFTTKSQGTGVGLATVRRVAEAHAGAVAIGPGAAGGTRFVLSLPLQAPAEA